MGRLENLHEGIEHLDEGGLLFFSPDAEGEYMRDGFVRVRVAKEHAPGFAQDLNFAIGGYVPRCTRSDYVWLATALGEKCFK